MTLQQTAHELFQQQFHSDPDFIVRAPGRVNLIGEHTDYNDGFVFPMAIDRAAWIALRPRDDRHVNVYSGDFNEFQQFSLDNLVKPDKTTWVEYIKGVAWALQENNYKLNGWEGVVVGDVPIGSGLSSSAALELVTARAFYQVSAQYYQWQPADMAKIGRKAENEWLGIKTGIMDQMISAAGVENRALLIDCRTLATQTAPLPPDTVVIILDTSTRRGLVDSKYNERREQCEAAAAFFGVPALRDVDIDTFNAHADELDPLIRQRARHIITENDRTLQAKTAMDQGDAETLGQLMIASHISLRDDFEVSSAELDSIVDCANQHSACYGARMTGAGFGGAAVALVKADSADEFVKSVTDCYTSATEYEPIIYICKATNGAELIFPQ